jgi:hypothetical protein
MTLVELLAATILAAMLMAAVLGVLKGVTREQRALRGSASPMGWQTQLIRQLEWDLTNSRTLKMTASGFRLHGFAGRDFVSGAPLHCRTRIEYAVENMRGKSFLMRSEAHLNSPSLDNQSFDLVCNQIERIVLTPGQGGAPAANAGTANRDQADEGSIPNQPVVMLYSIGQEKPVFEHAFILP